MSSRQPWWRRHGWVIGAAAGLAVAVPTGVATQEFQESREAADMQRRVAAFEAPPEEVPPPGDGLRELLEQDTRLVVDPTLQDQLTPEQRATIEDALTRAEVPTRLAYLTADQRVDDGYTTTGAVRMWSHGVGETGHYAVLFSDGRTDIDAVGLEVPLTHLEGDGQPGPSLLRMAEQLEQLPAEELPTHADPASDDDYWGGVRGGVGLLVLAGGFGVVPAFLALRWWVRSRRRAH